MSSNELPASAPAISSKPERLYHIDWLRLMAVFLLLFFHTARIFDPWENFYVQNAQLSPLLFDIFIWSLSPWQMSLFFLLAGASTYYSLQRRGGGQYVKERFKRLLVPFVFGVLILIPPQSYLGLLNHSGYSESFLSWFPNFFILQGDDIDGYFIGGHTWGHLWFIIHLFVYSLIAVRLFLYFNGESGRRLINRLAGAFTKPGVIFLFPVLLVLMDEFPEIAGGNPLFYITFFICGYLFMSDSRFTDTIDRRRIILLVMGPVIFAAYLSLQGTNTWPADLPGSADRMVDGYVDSFVPWFVILTLLAYGRRHLNFNNRFLKYFAEGAYPIYILHQTIIVIVGYFVVQWDVAVGVKYTAIVLLSFTSTVLAYDILMKRTNVTRFLFGMRPRKGVASRT
jgi:peptidoglycan/LPS O-acetylase OafA/YrhL